jgi:NADH-quinone oxidoreductase subunit I
MKRREEMSFLESIYVVEVVKGLFITVGSLIKNLTYHTLLLFGIVQENKISASIQYPNERRNYPSRYRGRHRLTLKQNGSVTCTACFLCATACPARCIHIVPSEHDDANIEKFPDRYEIDTLLCIYCGYCVEACPVDAIRMDTGLHPEVYPPDPRLFIEDKEVLMQRSKELEVYGATNLYQMHMKKMQNIEIGK